MNFRFSVTNSPISTASVALKTIYEVHATPEYDILKSEYDSRAYIAIRTLEGEGVIKFEGKPEITVLPQSLVILEYSKIRRYYCSSDKWNFWWFEFTLTGELYMPLNQVILIEKIENEAYYCSSSLNLLSKFDAASRALASAAFNYLICSWLLNTEQAQTINPHKAAIDKVVNYAREKFHEGNVSVSDMAACAGLSERRFREVFKEITKESPKKYFNRMRIEMACEMLRNTTLSVAEIAERLGFSSQFHFTRAFIKEYGIPPIRFRKS